MRPEKSCHLELKIRDSELTLVRKNVNFFLAEVYMLAEIHCKHFGYYCRSEICVYHVPGTILLFTHGLREASTTKSLVPGTSPMAEIQEQCGDSATLATFF